jgi:hypothetical protein
MNALADVVVHECRRSRTSVTVGAIVAASIEFEGFNLATEPLDVLRLLVLFGLYLLRVYVMVWIVGQKEVIVITNAKVAVGGS